MSLRIPAKRWEQGSSFNLMMPPPGARLKGPWDGRCAYFASGRDALRALITAGCEAYDWRRLWIPSYFCQEVTSSLRGLGLPVEIYEDAPCEGPRFPAARPASDKDVVLTVNYFGLRSAPVLMNQIYEDCFVIEDHTHDPWSDWAFNSRAAYCLASLRKTLPIPDGAVVWSPGKFNVPQPSPTSLWQTQASSKKLAGMMLKSLYLIGGEIAKEDYRTMLAEGELLMDSGTCSPISEVSHSLLSSWPTRTWRAGRLTNFRRLTRLVSDLQGVAVLQPDDLTSSCPFVVSMVFDSGELRGFVRKSLIDRRIYPVVLWDLGNNFVGCPQHASMSRRILCIHCDMRYGAGEMRKVAQALRIILAEFSGLQRQPTDL